MNTVHSILIWLGGQEHALASVVSAVVVNHPEPARRVLIYLVVAVALTWAITKIIRKVTP